MLADKLMQMLKISLLKKKIPSSFSSLVTVKYTSRGKKRAIVNQLSSSKN